MHPWLVVPIYPIANPLRRVAHVDADSLLIILCQTLPMSVLLLHPSIMSVLLLHPSIMSLLLLHPSIMSLLLLHPSIMSLLLLHPSIMSLLLLHPSIMTQNTYCRTHSVEYFKSGYTNLYLTMISKRMILVIYQ